MQPITNIDFAVGGYSFNFHMTFDATSPADRDTMTCMQEFGCPEPELMHLLVRTVRPGDFVVDGGANMGFFTIAMAQLVGESGSVLAVEPSEANLHKLAANIALNKLKNIEVCDRPLWRSNEMVTLYYSSHPGMNSLGNHVPMAAKRQMQATTLNYWNTTPRLIKLDIEGAEEQALYGASKHLTEHCPYIVAELNPEALQGLGSSQESLRKFMREWGYSTFLLHRNGALPTLAPDQTSIFEGDNFNGAVNVLFSTVDDVGKAWPRAVL